MSTSILIVEDEAAIRELLCMSLENAGFRVVQADSASAAQGQISERLPDLAIIDWMMPRVSGLELIRSLRRDPLTRSLPIIMLTARSDERDVIQGLDCGADDYLSKPFSPRELISRIKALQRRASGYDNDSVLEIGAVRLDETAHRITVGGEELQMGQTEYRLLRFLMQNPERVYSRAQLLDSVWGRTTFIEERTVDVHILRLRKALKDRGVTDLIDTVRGAGYRLTAATTDLHKSPDC